MKPSEQLRAAQVLVARGWCRRHMAEDALGRSVHVNDLAKISATKYCLIGACYAVGAIGVGAVVRQYLRRILRVEWEGDWNDAPGRTQAEVLAAFDAAIALAESEGR